MKLLAISGGPDSMFLLDLYKNKNVVVAHVNYHKREDSDNDENIVKQFCKKQNIPFEVLNVKTKSQGNFQSWARNIRYAFFKEVYDKYNCDSLILAHHKDDFLETAIMQQSSGRTPKYFGIKKKNKIDDMNIYRPFIDLYWKEEIIKKMNKKGIHYATDSSNSEPIFERNKIRIDLMQKTEREKHSMYQWFKMSNKILEKKFKKIFKIYSKWKTTGFQKSFFQKSKFQEELVYEFVYDHCDDINLSTKKIKSLIDYIVSPNGGKKFLLKSNVFVTKTKGRIEIVVSK